MVSQQRSVTFGGLTPDTLYRVRVAGIAYIVDVDVVDGTKPVAGAYVESLGNGSITSVMLTPTSVQGPEGQKGSIGNTGPQGPSGTVAIGTVTTAPPGTSVTVTNSGTETATVLNFVIPQGETGTA